MFFAHGEGGVQKCEDIPLILRHYCIFGDIGSQMLHLAETAHNCLLRWRRGGAVAGSYNFHPGAVGCLHKSPHRIVPFGQFNVNQIHKAGLYDVKIHCNIFLRFHARHSALRISAEREQNRSIP